MSAAEAAVLDAVCPPRWREGHPRDLRAGYFVLFDGLVRRVDRVQRVPKGWQVYLDAAFDEPARVVLLGQFALIHYAGGLLR